jgi:hypothetical protein
MEWLWIGGVALVLLLSGGAVLRARAKRKSKSKEEAAKDIYPMW